MNDTSIEMKHEQQNQLCYFGQNLVSSHLVFLNLKANSFVYNQFEALIF